MKVLVLGGTGMLGAYSSLALKSVGHEVVAAARRQSDNGFFADYGIDYVGGWNIEVPDTFSGLPTDLDAVVNMAGYMPAHGDSSAMPYVTSIVEGTVNLCEWLRARTSCRRVVFNTTPADIAAFAGTGPVPSDAPRSFPKNGGDHAVYAICKVAATDLLEHYRIAYGFRPCVFRHMTVFGWHPNASFNVNGRTTVSPWRQVVRRALVGQPVEVWGDPGRCSELLYIDDFTEAVCRAVASDASGIYNLPGVRPYSLDEEFQTIIDVFGGARKSAKVYRPEKKVAATVLLDGAKTKRELGWSAVVPWCEACERIKSGMLQNRFAKIWGEADEEDRI